MKSFTLFILVGILIVLFTACPPTVNENDDDDATSEDDDDTEDDDDSADDDSFDDDDDTADDDDDNDDDDTSDDDATDDDDDNNDSDECTDGWKDSVTDLCWQITPTGGEMNWTEAKVHCNSLKGSWRLPTISELRSIIRGHSDTQTGGSCPVTDACLAHDSCWSSDCFGTTDFAGPGIDGCYMVDELGSCTAAAWLWSNSNDPNDTEKVWAVYYGSGGLGYDSGSIDLSVRCVR